MDLLTNPTFLWLAAGVVLLILEFIIPGVLVIFFSFGAFIMMLLTWILPLTVDQQLIGFLLISVLSLITLRKYLKHLFHGRKTVAGEDADDQKDELIGKRVIVTVAISPKSPGRVSLNGTEWSAESTSECSTGERVIITDRDSLVLTVEKES